VARKRASRSKKKKGEGLLSAEQQRDILGVGLLALGIFVALSLVPPAWFGAGAGESFPDGNLVGPLGTFVRGVLRGVVGGAAPLAPLFLALAGLRTAGWLTGVVTPRLLAFVLGLGLLVPIGFDVWLLPGAGGWLGGLLATPLVDAIGWLGATVVEVTALVALSVATIGWNPIRTLVAGVAGGGRLAQKGVEVASDRIETWQEERARRAAEEGASEYHRVSEAPAWSVPWSPTPRPCVRWWPSSPPTRTWRGCASRSNVGCPPFSRS